MRRLRLVRNLLLLTALAVLFAPGCSAEAPLDSGDRALAAGDAAAAERHYRAALADAEEEERALIEDRLARAAVVARRERMHAEGAAALVAHGDFAAAANEFERALAVDPNAVAIRLSLAEVLLRTGRAEEAKIHLDELLRDEAAPAEAHVLAARFHYGRGDYPEALAALRVALRADPAHAAAKRALARMEREWSDALGRRDAQARAAFAAGVRALYAKSDERAFELLTASLSDAEPAEAGQVAEATVGEAVCDGYGRAPLYANLALACLRTGRVEEALGYLSLLAPLMPRSPHVAAKMARVYESQELWEDAVRHYEAAARRGALPGLKAQLAFACRKAGRYEDSARAFREATLEEPENPYLRYNLAVMLRKTGERDAARAELLKAREFAPPGTPFAYTIDEHLLSAERDAALETPLAEM